MSDWHRALVTGASRGIGEAFARRLAADGADLVLVARSGAQLEQLATELRRSHGIDVEVLVADLGTSDGCAAVERRLTDTAAPVDLLVNNAGIGGNGAFDALDRDRAVQQVELNVLAPVRLTHAALQGMRARSRGGVINVSSLSGLQPYPYGAVYGASKTFLNHFSAAVHTETADAGVRVLALCPGFTRTQHQQDAGISRTPIPDALWLRPEQVVDDGLAALRAGRTRRVVGLPYRLWAALLRVLPAPLVQRLLARMGSSRS
jgi:hypothetical protein